MKNNKLMSAWNSLPICNNWKYWIIAPIVVLVVAIVLVAVLSSSVGVSNAFNIGIDFEGGTLITVTLGQDAIDNYDTHVKNVTEKVESFGVEISYVQLQEAANVNETAISFRYKNISSNDDEIAELNNAIINAVDMELYPEMPGNVSFDQIGATAAQDLLSKSGIALAVSMALILIYIIIRFTPASGLAAVLALLHDVIIMFCLTVICRIQINSSFVAAVITIVAYSINNTIVIFDRCRENIKPFKGQKDIPYEAIGDASIKENMRRSLFTTFTTMVTVIFLAILGSDSIREFCVPIILGLIAGVYSSVLLATPMWCGLSRAFDKVKAKRHAGEISYDHLKSDEEEDETVFKGEANPYSDDNLGDEQVPAKEPKKEKKKNNTVYKYSKKNTTFKNKK